MLEKLLGLFTDRPKKKIADTSSSNSSVSVSALGTSVPAEKIFGYMFIFESEHLKKLDIEGVKAGKINAFMQAKAKMINGFKATYIIYSTVEELVSKESKQKDCPPLDGSCYVIGVKYPAEQTYELIRTGKFSEIIATTENFYDCVERVSSSQNDLSLKILTR